MKNILILFIISSSIFASSNITTSQQDRIAKQLEIDMEKEKKYAREQTFYNASNYDFKGSEVNPETVERLNEIEVDDLDMDSVYD